MDDRRVCDLSGSASDPSELVNCKTNRFFQRLDMQSMPQLECNSMEQDYSNKRHFLMAGVFGDQVGCISLKFSKNMLTFT